MKKIVLIVCSLLWITNLLNAQSKDTFSYHFLPLKYRLKVDVLTENICNAADKDQKRVENIFYWVSHYIKVDVKRYNKQKISYDRTPNEILKSKKGDADDFAVLIKAMCESAGIRCQVIQGYEKNDLYENGAGFYKPNHTWNAILVNNKWELADAYNAAGDIEMDLSWFKKQLQKINKKKLYTSTKVKFIQNYYPDFLFQNPEEVRLSKIPVDPLWQLTDTIMPLAIFEKTEEDIRYFNEKYSEISKYKTELSIVNALDKDEQIIECADRTFEYNPRYTEMKAKKHLSLANLEYKKLKNVDLEKQEKDDAIKKGNKEIGTCKDYLMKQKQEIGKEYNELQQVNNEKRTDVIKYKQKFTTTNTKFITDAKSHLTAGNKKMSTLAAEAKAKKSGLVSKWNTIKTQNPEKKETSFEMITLKDSIAKRKERIENYTNLINSSKATIEKMQEDQQILVENLRTYILKTDSSFRKEAIARSRKQDSFDDSIKTIRSALYYYKTEIVDSLQKQYFDHYDTILLTYEKTKKNYTTIIDWTADNIKDYETYKKWNNSSITLENQYEESLQLNTQAKNGFINNNLSEINYIKNNKPAMASMKNVYVNQNKYFNYLVNNEDDRKALVKKVLEKNEQMEKKRNTQNIDNLKTTKEKNKRLRKKNS
jgi:hypothetical protein